MHRLLAMLLLALPVQAADRMLLPNGDLETDADRNGWPDQWPTLKEGAAYLEEDGNHFIRLTATEPNKLILLYVLVPLPAGVSALELTWRQRVSGFKRGKEAWHDARIMMEFKDAQGAKLKEKPGHPYTNKDTAGWVDRKAAFLIPAGATQLELMPCLFQVQSGRFDLDDLALHPTDPAALRDAKAKADADRAYANVPYEQPRQDTWPRPVHVQGNQLLDDTGQPVWLQGVNVVSLEFLVHGDHVLRSILVAIEDWQANAIRLPVKEDYWFGADAKDGGQAYRERVDAAVNATANRGAYLILDLHRFRAPTQAHVDFWKDAAARYKDHPAVLFDLFNEPHGTTWEVWRDGGIIQEQDESIQAVGMQALVDAARSTGAKNPVIVGGLDWAYDLTGIANGYALRDPDGHGILYATHIYPWKRDWAKKVLVAAKDHPIFVGEVGADIKKMDFIPLSAQEDPYTWSPVVLGFMQQHQLHWTGFSFHPAATPVMITGWDYTPTEFWGALAKRALGGERFPAGER